MVFGFLASLWRRTSAKAGRDAEAALLGAAVSARVHHRTVEHLNTVEIAVPAAAVDDGSGGRDRRAGRRLPLVMTHGYGAGLGLYFGTFDALAGSGLFSRVLAVDWAGMGRSSRTAPPWPGAAATQSATTRDTETYFCDSLEAWRKAEGLERFVLLGHSIGGYLAAVYAMRFPHRVAHLILASPVGLPRQPENSMKRWEKQPWRVRTLIKTARWLWAHDVTPQWATRVAGSYLGRAMLWKYVDRRLRPAHAHWARIGVAPEQVLEYLYHISAMGPGTGEFALSRLLAPGAYAHAPLVDRLAPASPRERRAARRAAAAAEKEDGSATEEEEDGEGEGEGESGLCAATTRVTFLYGSHDWMDHRHADRLLPALHAAGVEAEVLVVPKAGHQVFLDNADGFCGALLGARERALAKEADAARAGGGGQAHHAAAAPPRAPPVAAGGARL